MVIVILLTAIFRAKGLAHNWLINGFLINIYSTHNIPIAMVAFMFSRVPYCSIYI